MILFLKLSSKAPTAQIWYTVSIKNDNIGSWQHM